MDMMPAWFTGAIEPYVGADAGDLALAARAALAGGESVERCYGHEQDARSGRWGGPVTKADRASHCAILDVLTRFSPSDEIRSEEGDENDFAESGEAQQRLWLVDPLDGTREFLARNGEFSVMVGLSRKGRAALGAIYQPARDRLSLGVTRRGAWTVHAARKETRVRALCVDFETGKDRRSLRVVRSRSHQDHRLSRLADHLDDVKWLVSGSVGIKCAMIAEGSADLYVHPVPYLKEWDTCAPEAILAGAGGKVTDCLGATLEYGKADPHQPGGIFAAEPTVWEKVAPHVREIFDDSEGSGAKDEGSP